MKRAIFILSFVLSSNIYAQTTTEKYNSIMQQYEYFDSNGSMIGYKKYNSIMRQWEYYTVGKKTSNSYNQEYINPVDYNLVNNALAHKQNAYNNNKAKIQAKNEYIANNFEFLFKYKNIPAVNRRINEINSLYESYNKGIEDINSSNTDLSSNAMTYEIIKWLNQYQERLDNIIAQLRQEQN